ncbi:MAG TPA: hypothetical protein VHV57_21075 [Acidimicrobiales bacterium]|nr:hypothetical protein [Acidimicrobiales bacterium]
MTPALGVHLLASARSRRRSKRTQATACGPVGRRRPFSQREIVLAVTPQALPTAAADTPA